MDVSVGQAEQEVVHPRYWRLVYGTRNLLTIEVDRATGILNAITVIYGDQIKQLDPSQEHALLVKHHGIPQFSLGFWPPPEDYDWKNDFMDVPGQWVLAFGSNSLHMTLFEDEIAYTVAYEQKLFCHFNHADELCGVMFGGFSVQQFVRMKEWYG